jgi:hypothetical protein
VFSAAYLAFLFSDQASSGNPLSTTRRRVRSPSAARVNSTSVELHRPDDVDRGLDQDLSLDALRNHQLLLRECATNGRSLCRLEQPMVAGAHDQRTRVMEKAMELLQVVRESQSPTSRCHRHDKC